MSKITEVVDEILNVSQRFGIGLIAKNRITFIVEKAIEDTLNESYSWKDPKAELPMYEVDVLCDVMHFGTNNHHYAVLKRKNVDDAEWFTSDDDSEINSWNWQVVGWRYIKKEDNL